MISRAKTTLHLQASPWSFTNNSSVNFHNLCTHLVATSGWPFVPVIYKLPRKGPFTSDILFLSLSLISLHCHCSLAYLQSLVILPQFNRITFFLCYSRCHMDYGRQSALNGKRQMTRELRCLISRD